VFLATILIVVVSMIAISNKASKASKTTNIYNSKRVSLDIKITSLSLIPVEKTPAPTPRPIVAQVIGTADLSARLEKIKSCISSNREASKAEIASYVASRFGSYSKDAFVILSKENSSYNPDAYNINKDTMRSTDHGVFQINSYWNRYRYKDLCELHDWQRNIDIAWDIFKGRGYSWRAWSTCKYLNPCY
jgi:hypothetical protein